MKTNPADKYSRIFLLGNSEESEEVRFVIPDYFFSVFSDFVCGKKKERDSTYECFLCYAVSF
mgnify:CR=1 FL=1|tara:strand:- start:1771 stop:1956 length:186 start_codon:yes stop_codon:yes gene_type:complete